MYETNHRLSAHRGLRSLLLPSVRKLPFFRNAKSHSSSPGNIHSFCHVTRCQPRESGSPLCAGEGGLGVMDSYPAPLPAGALPFWALFPSLRGWPIYTVSVVPLSSSFCLDLSRGKLRQRTRGQGEWGHYISVPSFLPARMAQAGCRFYLVTTTLISGPCQIVLFLVQVTAYLPLHLRLRNTRPSIVASHQPGAQFIESLN